MGQCRVLHTCLSVGPTVAGGRAGLLGALTGGLCPSQVHGGSLWIAQRRPPLAPNRSLSVSVLALQRGGAVSGPGHRPSASPRLGPSPLGAVRWRVLKAPPSTLTPASPCSLGRRVHCCTAEIVKLNFPDVQAPGAHACCLERKWGSGKAAPHFLPAHPAFPVPPSTAGAVNHSRPALPQRGPLPQPPHLPPASCLQSSQPPGGLSGQPWGLGPGPREG